MSHINKVLRSIEMPDGDRCVDLFVRPDGTYGYEEYRRELEDGRGWFPIGFHSEAEFSSEEQALKSALDSVSWLKAVLRQ
jgi:ribosomal protein S18 acetylase RimI-like enzyme